MDRNFHRDFDNIRSFLDYYVSRILVIVIIVINSNR